MTIILHTTFRLVWIFYLFPRRRTFFLIRMDEISHVFCRTYITYLKLLFFLYVTLDVNNCWCHTNRFTFCSFSVSLEGEKFGCLIDLWDIFLRRVWATEINWRKMRKFEENKNQSNSRGSQNDWGKFMKFLNQKYSLICWWTWKLWNEPFFKNLYWTD